MNRRGVRRRKRSNGKVIDVLSKEQHFTIKHQHYLQSLMQLKTDLK